jgi:hypothetical protein
LKKRWRLEAGGWPGDKLVYIWFTAAPLIIRRCAGEEDWIFGFAHGRIKYVKTVRPGQAAMFEYFQMCRWHAGAMAACC